MTSTVPEVDYLTTSRRPRFESLPHAVRVAVGAVAGSRVRVAAPPVGSGFGGAFAGLLELDDGRRVFAKAAGPTTPHIQRALAREASLLPVLRGLGCASRLVGSVDVEAGGLWRILALEAIPGTQPGGPWTVEDADAAHAACLEIASAPAEVVAALGLGTAADDLVGEVDAVPTLEGLASGGRAWPAGHVVPDEDAASELAGLAAGVLDAVRGDALVHLDVRPDNLVREPSGRMRVVDWNQAVVGAPWVDLVSLWPLMHHHGVDVARFATSPCSPAPLTTTSTPSSRSWSGSCSRTSTNHRRRAAPPRSGRTRSSTPTPPCGCSRRVADGHSTADDVRRISFSYRRTRADWSDRSLVCRTHVRYDGAWPGGPSHSRSDALASRPRGRP